MFPDAAACAAWLIDMRWPGGFRCPECDHDKQTTSEEPSGIMTARGGEPEPALVISWLPAHVKGGAAARVHHSGPSG